MTDHPSRLKYTQRKEVGNISSHHNTQWHPYARPSTATTSHLSESQSLSQEDMRPQRQRSHCKLSSQKTKRVPVTSCDSCRLRKLKCNARDMPDGSTCDQCSKQGIRCTFDDRNEVQMPARMGDSSKSPTNRQDSTYPYPPPSIRSDSRGELPGYSQTDPKVRIDTVNQPNQLGDPNQVPNENGMMRKEIDDARFMPPLNGNIDWGHEQAGMVLASMAPTFTSPHQQRAIWDDWNVPSMVTDPDTGRLSPMKSQTVIELLVHRFYAQPSFNSIIVPNHGLTVNRLKFGNPTPIPSYLLHTIVACAAYSNLTTEKELQLWQMQVWHGATESVHGRLNRSGPPELELVQALLLLSCNWPGSLLRIERINTFDTAVSLANSLQLHSGRHLDVNPGPRSNRIILFWALFCADKILSILTNRPPAIPTESHSIPLPSLMEINASSALRPKTTIAAWLQRLTHAFIHLSQITEAVQVHLALPISLQRHHHHHQQNQQHPSQSQFNTLESIFRKILPIEKKLENFCKEQRWLLGSVSELSPICRSLAEAVISQLHFTQLHLYLPALQFEVEKRKNNAFTAQQPMRFAPENDKPLAATIESAWHLVQQHQQQLSNVNGASVRVEDILSLIKSFIASASGASSSSTSTSSPSSSLLDSNTSLCFTRAFVLIGLNFFKFLDTNWSEWNGGYGCLPYAPIRLPLSNKQLQHHHVQDDQNGNDYDSLNTPLHPPNDLSIVPDSDKARAHFNHAPKSSLHVTFQDEQGCSAEARGIRKQIPPPIQVHSQERGPDAPEVMQNKETDGEVGTVASMSSYVVSSTPGQARPQDEANPSPDEVSDAERVNTQSQD